MNINWNAKEYENKFSFVHHYGEDIINMIDAPQGSLVIDLGCGSGALTQKIFERGYSVIGVDGSAEMLKLAGENYPNLEFIEDDARFFKLKNKADVIFSNAVFHWIDENEQDKLLKNIRANLKDNGSLICEFGGFGCAEKVHSALRNAFKARGLEYPFSFYFPTIGEYAPRVEKAGFIIKEAYLFERPTPQEGQYGLKNWIKMFCKRAFMNVNENEKENIINEAVENARKFLFSNETWYVDYVRIRLKASAR
ncbi:MAG: methyltransferase domain-containing protein [Synergistaceae bacterium]|nr:methyltransferase domain-containing protein [Synergistaceae bacterium]